jgi:hypothetical protein
MFSEQDRSHPRWEFKERTQTRLVAAFVVGLVVLLALNMAGGWSYDFWNQQPVPAPFPALL